MSNPRKRSKLSEVPLRLIGYDSILSEIVELLESARRVSARAVNAVMTTAYWEIGRRIVHVEMGGKDRAAYGEQLVRSLSRDLTARFGRGFGRASLYQMRAFYLAYPEIVQSAIGQSGPVGGDQKVQSAIGQSGPVQFVPAKSGTAFGKSGGTDTNVIVQSVIAQSPRRFPLPWTHYVRLLSVKNPLAREFYEIEALRGGWTVKQLNRQIGTQFYERTALSKNKAAMLTKGQKPKPEDAVSAHEEIKDSFVLEFLGLKDEYSESDLEEALIQHLEKFLLELGGDFTFVGRQRRLRIGDEWYRVDLVFFHRGLRCLVIVDLKLDRLTTADVGQMHLYCNYARAHWTRPDENPPVGIILCAGPSESLARYALDGLPNPMLVREYRTLLPDEQLLADELTRTRRLLEARRTIARPRRRK